MPVHLYRPLDDRNYLDAIWIVFMKLACLCCILDWYVVGHRNTNIIIPNNHPTWLSSIHSNRTLHLLHSLDLQHYVEQKKFSDCTFSVIQIWGTPAIILSIGFLFINDYFQISRQNLSLLYWIFDSTFGYVHIYVFIIWRNRILISKTSEIVII